jgi:hypothetical protein
MSLINDALKRADGAQGPRRPVPVGPLPASAKPVRHIIDPPPAPDAAPPRKGNFWRTVQAVVLGAALVSVAAAGVLIWKRFGDSPAQVVAAQNPLSTLSSVVAALSPAPAAQEPAATDPSGSAADAGQQRSSLVLVPARPAQAPKAADPLSTTANLSSSVTGVSASPPTLFMDARKSQNPSDSVPLTPTESRLATIDAVSPSRLAAAFAAPAAGAPAPPAATPAAPPPPAPAPAAEPPKLKVTSIFYNARSPTAIINGQVIGVGETIEGAKIVAISPRSVDVMVDGKRVTLRL